MKVKTVVTMLAGIAVFAAASADLHALKIEPQPLPSDRAALYDVAPAVSPAVNDLRRGSFSANLVITDSEAKFRKWLSLSPGDREKFARSQKFRPGQKGHLVLVLTDFKVDPAAEVSLRAELSLIGPDGKLVYQHRDLGKSAWGHPKQGFLAIEPYVDFTFDAEDRPGTYTYRVTVADKMRGEVVMAEEKVVLVR